MIFQISLFYYRFITSFPKKQIGCFAKLLILGDFCRKLHKYKINISTKPQKRENIYTAFIFTTPEADLCPQKAGKGLSFYLAKKYVKIINM